MGSDYIMVERLVYAVIIDRARGGSEREGKSLGLSGRTFNLKLHIFDLDNQK